MDIRHIRERTCIVLQTKSLREVEEKIVLHFKGADRKLVRKRQKGKRIKELTALGRSSGSRP